MPEPMRLRMQSLAHAPAEPGDEALGRELVARLRHAIERGAAPASAVAARDGRVDLVTLAQLGDASAPHFVAALSRSEVPGAGPVDAVGFIGSFFRRSHPGEPGVPVALVFLEWPDCRWWFWRALLDPTTGAVREDTVTVSSAADGDPKPDGLGGWWSLGRRAGLAMRLVPDAPAIVH